MLPETCYESAHMNCYRVKYDKANKRTIEYKHNTKSKFRAGGNPINQILSNKTYFLK